MSLYEPRPASAGVRRIAKTWWARTVLSLPGLEEQNTMFKELQKRFESTESYISLALGLAVVLVIGVLIYNVVSSRNKQTLIDTGATTSKQGEQKATEDLPGNHTVAAGETLWSISEKYYKTGYNWGDIAKANSLPNADLIEAGQKIVIPTVTPIMPQGQVASGTTATQPIAKTYTVVHGDTLWKIATTMYNDGYKWVEIAKANKLKEPNLIHPGNVLTLP